MGILSCADPRGAKGDRGDREFSRCDRGQSDRRDARAARRPVFGREPLRGSRSEEAAKHYEAAINVRPRFMDIRTKFAGTLIDSGDLEKAKTELLVILESRPGFVGARIRLGVVLQRTGDTDGAIREWKQCAADDPADMRPRAYLASVGVTFPHVHPGTDGD